MNSQDILAKFKNCEDCNCPLTKEEKHDLLLRALNAPIPTNHALAGISHLCGECGDARADRMAGKDY